MLIMMKTCNYYNKQFGECKADAQSRVFSTPCSVPG